MLGPGFERVTGTGVTTVGGVTTTGATEERGFLCLRRRDRGAMACPLIPGDYMQNRYAIEVCKLNINVFAYV